MMKPLYLIQAWRGRQAGFRTTRTAPNRRAAEQQAADLCNRAEYGADADRPEDVRIVRVTAASIAEAIALGDRGYKTELTETREQFLIPGCERAHACGQQLELFS